MKSDSTIKEFIGEYHFLSNFYVAPIEYNGKEWQSSEHLYQALKSLDKKEQDLVRQANSPGRAKKLGRKITIRPDWAEVKDDIMKQIVRAKFTQNKDLKEKLIATAPRPLEEGNTWGDTYWGVNLYTGIGLNVLGKILEDLRDEFLFKS